jgi:hypothetical protein
MLVDFDDGGNVAIEGDEDGSDEELFIFPIIINLIYRLYYFRLLHYELCVQLSLNIYSI